MVSKMPLDELIEQARLHGFFLLPINQKRGYTQSEIDLIVDMTLEERPLIEICREAQRTPNSVMKKLREVGAVKFDRDYYTFAHSGVEWMHFSEFQDAKDEFERLYPKLT